MTSLTSRPSRPAGGWAQLLDVKPDTLRGWIERVEVDAGERPGVPSSVDARIKQLERALGRSHLQIEILKNVLGE